MEASSGESNYQKQAPVEEDLFDSVVNLEAQFFDEGFADGLRTGLDAGFQDGSVTGYAAGFSAGEEIGYMITFLELCFQSPKEREKGHSLLLELDAQLDACARSLDLRRPPLRTGIESAPVEQSRPVKDGILTSDDAAARIAVDAAAVERETAVLIEWARARQPAEHQEAFSSFSTSLNRSRILLAKLCVRLRLSRTTSPSSGANELSF